MKKYSVVLLSILLAACGGKSDKPADPTQPPKPEFAYKYIINTEVLKDLPLGEAVKETVENKVHTRYAIKGLPEGNTLDLIGEHDGDLEGVTGQCSGDDIKAAWAKEGACYQVFSKFVGNIAKDPDTLSNYLTSHAYLQPYEAKGGYAAVQTGRYVLELDSKGTFTFRRRTY